MDQSRLDVPVTTLLGARSLPELLALFDAYPGLLEESGIGTLSHLADIIVSEPHREQMEGIYAIALACLKHGPAALTAGLAGIGVTSPDQPFRTCWPALILKLGAADLKSWATAKLRMGAALMLREHQGDPLDDIVPALECFMAVRDATSPETLPSLWAQANSELGAALGHGLEDYEAAIPFYLDALRVYTSETHWQDWVQATANLSVTFFRWNDADKAAHEESGIKLLEEILEAAERRGKQIPGYVYGSLQSAYHAGPAGAAADGDRAFANLRRAAGLLGDRKEAAKAWHDLGAAYRDRPRGDSAENIDRAIDCLKASLDLQDAQADPAMWAATQNDLALAYLLRFHGNRAANVAEAIAAADAVTAMTLPDEVKGSAIDAWNILGMAIMRRPDYEAAVNIGFSVFCFETALALCDRTQDPIRWAQTASNLATAYLQWDSEDADENREQGIRYLKQALCILEEHGDRLGVATNLWNLGLGVLARRGGDPAASIRKAAEYFRRARASGGAALRPAQIVRRYVAEAEALIDLGRPSWRKALRRIDAAFALLGRHWDETVTPEARKELITAVSRAGRWSALIHAASGDPAKALERLERSRGIILREALALDEALLGNISDERRNVIEAARRRIARLRGEAGLAAGARPYLVIAEELKAAEKMLADALSGVGDRKRPLDIGEILAAIPAGSILLVPVPTEFGGIIFVVPAGSDRLDGRHVVEAPDLRVGVLRQHLANWLAAHRGVWEAFGSRESLFEKRWQAASNILEEILDWLGQTVMEPALARAAELGMQDPRQRTGGSAASLVIMPAGDLAVMPLHAAFRSGGSERRAVLDDYAVSYTPSIHALRTAQQRREKAGRDEAAGGLLALINPTNDLRFSEGVEVPVLRRFFPDTADESVLVGDSASKRALKQFAPGRRYLHLSCHGRFDRANPEESGLKLAHGEWLTVREILAEIELDGCRWVMLSACETGVTDVEQTPEEAIGQVAAFQMAGAACVMAALWAIPDRSTALFTAKVYEEHLAGGCAPAQAVRRAVLWLKELPATALDDLLAWDGVERGLSPRFAELTTTAKAQDLRPDAAAERPFASPLHWAAFSAWGV